jgi:ribosomal-protein-serine acetyltransferase
VNRPFLPRDLGGGLVIHAATAADADESYAIVDVERERLREWLPWVDHTTSADVTREFLANAARSDAASEAIHTALRLDGALVGFADLRLNLLFRTGEVGYWLAAAAVGKGVITRVVAELFEIGFAGFGLHRIQLQVATGNVRSRAVAERLGMYYEGIRREAEALPSGFVDLAVYSTLEHEWPGAEAALARAGAQSARPR